MSCNHQKLSPRFLDLAANLSLGNHQFYKTWVRFAFTIEILKYMVALCGKRMFNVGTEHRCTILLFWFFSLRIQIVAYESWIYNLNFEFHYVSWIYDSMTIWFTTHRNLIRVAIWIFEWYHWVTKRKNSVLWAIFTQFVDPIKESTWDFLRIFHLYLYPKKRLKMSKNVI